VGKSGIREKIEYGKVYEALKENNFVVIERFAPQGRSKDRARTRSLEGYFSNSNFSRLTWSPSTRRNSWNLYNKRIMFSVVTGLLM